MLQVELDIFSGVPNPTWILSEQQEAELFERLSAQPDQLSPARTMSRRLGLGYRGLIVRRIKSDAGAWERATLESDISFPDEFRVGVKAAEEELASDWLVETAAQQGTPIATDVQELVSQGASLLPRPRGSAAPERAIDLERIRSAERPADVPLGPEVDDHNTWWACPSNFFSANISFFNDPAHVTRNNCYCFASNHRPDIRYALPGLYGGHPATSITCGGVIDGLRADGWTSGCQHNCLTIALVIWPHNDYHFYRLVTGGPYWWWGHKPGGTPAKYTDDCGNYIYQYQGKGYAPNNICRGPYTDFCDYFYQNNSTAFVA